MNELTKEQRDEAGRRLHDGLLWQKTQQVGLLQEQVATLTAEREHFRKRLVELEVPWRTDEARANVERLRDQLATPTKERDTFRGSLIAEIALGEDHLETIRTLREVIDDSTDLLRKVTGTLAYDADIQWVRNQSALATTKHYDVKDGDG